MRQGRWGVKMSLLRWRKVERTRFQLNTHRYVHMLKTLVCHLKKEAAELFVFGAVLLKMWSRKCLCHSCLEHQFKCRFPNSSSIFWIRSSLHCGKPHVKKKKKNTSPLILMLIVSWRPPLLWECLNSHLELSESICGLNLLSAGDYPNPARDFSDFCITMAEHTDKQPSSL